jgi:hypothetical protein
MSLCFWEKELGMSYKESAFIPTTSLKQVFSQLCLPHLPEQLHAVLSRQRLAAPLDLLPPLRAGHQAKAHARVRVGGVTSVSERGK